jgi:hypothetical protein
MQDGKQGGITPFQAKGGNHTNLLHVAAINEEQKNWPTVYASEVRQGFQDRSRGMKGSQESLTTVVIKDAATNGQAAPANPSTDGSRQGLWVTPRTSGTSTRPNKTTPRQGLTLVEQAREQEKMWRTPSVAEEKNQNTSTQIYLQNQVGATPKAWATPQASDHIEGARTELTSNQKCLGRDMKEWGTPTARDHKSGRGNEEREYKELTPMVERTQTGKLNPRWVETLMGLPVGWVMPSCKSPVTIEQTNCDSSETESCLPPQSELLEF